MQVLTDSMSTTSCRSQTLPKAVRVSTGMA